MKFDGRGTARGTKEERLTHESLGQHRAVDTQLNVCVVSQLSPSAV